MSITYEPINVVDQLSRISDSYLRVSKEDVPYGQLRVRHREGEAIVEVQCGLHVTKRITHEGGVRKLTRIGNNKPLLEKLAKVHVDGNCTLLYDLIERYKKNASFRKLKVELDTFYINGEDDVYEDGCDPFECNPENLDSVAEEIVRQKLHVALAQILLPATAKWETSEELISLTGYFEYHLRPSQKPTAAIAAPIPTIKTAASVHDPKKSKLKRKGTGDDDKENIENNIFGGRVVSRHRH